MHTYSHIANPSESSSDFRPNLFLGAKKTLATLPVAQVQPEFQHLNIPTAFVQQLIDRQANTINAAQLAGKCIRPNMDENWFLSDHFLKQRSIVLDYYVRIW